MYLVRQIKKNTYEIAKFEDTNYAVDVYTITNNKCNCPASWRSTSCKHHKILTEYKKDTDSVYVFELTPTNEVKKRSMLNSSLL